MKELKKKTSNDCSLKAFIFKLYQTMKHNLYRFSFSFFFCNHHPLASASIIALIISQTHFSNNKIASIRMIWFALRTNCRFTFLFKEEGAKKFCFNPKANIFLLLQKRITLIDLYSKSKRSNEAFKFHFSNPRNHAVFIRHFF